MNVHKLFIHQFCLVNAKKKRRCCSTKVRSSVLFVCAQGKIKSILNRYGYINRPDIFAHSAVKQRQQPDYLCK